MQQFVSSNLLGGQPIFIHSTQNLLILLSNGIPHYLSLNLIHQFTLKCFFIIIFHITDCTILPSKQAPLTVHSHRAAQKIRSVAPYFSAGNLMYTLPWPLDLRMTLRFLLFQQVMGMIKSYNLARNKRNSLIYVDKVMKKCNFVSN